MRTLQHRLLRYNWGSWQLHLPNLWCCSSTDTQFAVADCASTVEMNHLHAQQNDTSDRGDTSTQETTGLRSVAISQWHNHSLQNKMCTLASHAPTHVHTHVYITSNIKLQLGQKKTGVEKHTSPSHDLLTCFSASMARIVECVTVTFGQTLVRWLDGASVTSKSSKVLPTWTI